MYATALILFVGLAEQKPVPRVQEAPVVRSFYRAVLKTPGGELPFLLTIAAQNGDFVAAISNGSDQTPVSRAVADGAELTLELDPYDSTIEALGDEGSDWAHGRYSTRMRGTWKKRIGKDQWAQLEFFAEPYKGFRFKPLSKPAGAESSYPPIVGRWSVRFSKSDDPAVGIFKELPDGQIEGTFLTTTGDYGFLGGSYEHGKLRLSNFDGAHAFLFEAQMQTDGTLKGDFWSRAASHETWTAKRDDNASLPDGFSLSNWTGGKPLADMKFPNLAGQLRSLDDPAFQGKARVLEIFGSWCPNCNDAAKYLADLDRRYRAKGLSIVGLAFELTGDLARDTAQVQKFIERNDVEYPVLIAGVSEKTAAAAAFPLLDRIRAYPTTILLHADGTVRAVHTGFSGPATGPEYDKLKRKFEDLIAELLAASPAGK